MIFSVSGLGGGGSSSKGGLPGGESNGENARLLVEGLGEWSTDNTCIVRAEKGTSLEALLCVRGMSEEDEDERLEKRRGRRSKTGE